MPQGITAGRVARASWRVARWMLAMLKNGRLPAGVGAVALAATLTYLLTDAQYTIRRVVVTGVASIPAPAVAEASGVLGRGVFSIDATTVAMRVTQLPGVQRAEVYTESPGTLVIHVTERQPALVWDMGAQAYVVDRGGVVLAQIGPDALPDLPRLSVRASDTPIAVGQRVDVTPVRSALALVDRLPAEAGVTKAAIIADPLVGLIVQTDQWRAVVGNDDHLGEKLAVLKGLVPDHTWTDVDLRDPSRVALVRPQPATAVPTATIPARR